jgi:hypothetical protein
VCVASKLLRILPEFFQEIIFACFFPILHSLPPCTHFRFLLYLETLGNCRRLRQHLVEEEGLLLSEAKRNKEKDDIGSRKQVETTEIGECVGQASLAPIANMQA